MFFTINYNSFDNKMKIIIKDVNYPYTDFNLMKTILQESQVAIVTDIKYFGVYDSNTSEYKNNAVISLLWYYNVSTLNIQYYIETFGEFLFNFNGHTLKLIKYEDPTSIIDKASSIINNIKYNIKNETHAFEELQLQKIAYSVAEYVLDEDEDEDEDQDQDEDQDYDYDEHLYHNEYSKNHIIQPCDFN